MPEPTFNSETGVNIPVELPKGIAELLAQPICADISLPKPAKQKLTLPSGGSLPGVTDFTKGIPDNCSVGFSLLLQLGPFLGSIQCLINILNLIKPLIDVINGLPFPPVKALKEFAEAVPPVVECFTAFSPTGGLLLFVRDLLCLIIKLVSCMIDQLKSIAAVMDGLSIQFEAAADNPQLLSNLECAQENAKCAAEGAVAGFEPVLVLLELAAPVVKIVTGQSIEIPSLAAPEDVEQINTVIGTLEEFVNVLELLVEPLGGCDG